MLSFLQIFFILLLSNVIELSRTSPVTKIAWFPNGNGKVVLAQINPDVDFKFFFSGGSQDREKHVHFLLHTFERNDSYELYIGDEIRLRYSSFNASIPTKVIIHGFTNNARFGFSPAAKMAYLNGTNPVNVIVVDWGKLAEAPWYNEAARNTRLVGEKVAQFIEFLVEQGCSLDQMHIIGHSLGAHVAGFAGSYSKNITLSRITALDPALPLFESASDENRIDPSDATYVDVIHTAGGSSTNFMGTTSLAFIEPRGHADFYVNGGRSQPGCGMDVFGCCAHLRAYEYYLETVSNPDGFPSCACESWEEYKVGSCVCSEVAYLGEQSSARHAKVGQISRQVLPLHKLKKAICN